MTAIAWDPDELADAIAVADPRPKSSVIEAHRDPPVRRGTRVAIRCAACWGHHVEPFGKPVPCPCCGSMKRGEER